MNMRICVVLFATTLAFTGCSNSQPTSKLLEDLNSSEEADRLVAVRLLQNRKTDTAKVLPALVKSLTDAHADIRRSAAIGLGYLGADAKDAIPDLEKAKSDQDRRVRDAAAVAISRIEGKK